MPTPTKLFQLSVSRKIRRRWPGVYALMLCLLGTLFIAGCPESSSNVNGALSAASAADSAMDAAENVAGEGMVLAVMAATATPTFTPAPPTPTETLAPPTFTPTVTPVPPTPWPRFIPAPTATATSVPVVEPVEASAPASESAPSAGAADVAAAAATGGEFAHNEWGVLSYMCDCLHGNRTASGEPYNKDAFVAAHKSLPFGTQVRVTNLTNGLTAHVTIVDRLPHNNPHMIDVSSAVARQLDLIRAGNADAVIEWN